MMMTRPLAILTARTQRNLLTVMTLQLVVDLEDRRNRLMGMMIIPPAVEDMAQAPSSLTATTKTQLVDPMVDKKSRPTEIAETKKTATHLAIPVAAQATQGQTRMVKIPQIPRMAVNKVADRVVVKTTMRHLATPMVDKNLRVTVETMKTIAHLARADMEDLEDKVEILIPTIKTTAPAVDMAANRAADRVVVPMTTRFIVMSMPNFLISSNLYV
jgi:hypothetical protein